MRTKSVVEDLGVRDWLGLSYCILGSLVAMEIQT